jgi:hypothetical protein
MNPLSLKAVTISLAVFFFSLALVADWNFEKLMTGIWKESDPFDTVASNRLDV